MAGNSHDASVWPRRIAAGAALGYVAGAGVENMEALGAPLLGAPASEVRAAFSSHDLVAVTSIAGALSLVLFGLFAALLLHVLDDDRRQGGGWLTAALVGAVAGPVLAAGGLAVSVPLVTDPAGLSDDTVRALHDAFLGARFVAGPFMGLFLLGAGVAGLRSGVLPRWLAWPAVALAAPLALGPVAAFTADEPLQVGVAVAFGAHSLWIFAVGLWLALGTAEPWPTLVRRAAFLTLVLAAGLVGLAMLAVPGATGTFFAWGLGPPALAAFAGGVYVGSAVTYGLAVPATWRQTRGLVAGAAVLSVSVLVATLAHLDVFDFDRLQAWAWVVLFAGFSVITTGLVVVGRPDADEEPDARLPPAARLGLAALAVLYGVVAAALWVDPTGLSGPSPFALSALGGRFAGSWIALLACLAAWAAARDSVVEARLPAVGLVALPAGALVGALRTFGDLDSGSRVAYVAVLALLAGAGAAIAARLWRARE